MSSPPNRRTRVGYLLIAGALIVVLLLLVYWQLRGTSDPDDAKGRATNTEHGRSGGGDGERPSLKGPRDAPAQAAGEAKKPIIDRIEVEKPEVCEGEENLIKVFAHTEGNTDDAYLKYMVAGTPGQQAVLRPRIRDAHEAKSDPAGQVMVFGRNGISTKVPICVEQPGGWNTCGANIPALAARFKVKACAVAREALIKYRALPNSWDEFEFSVEIRDVTAKKPLEPISYQWSFGDNSAPVTTRVPVVEHSFEDRPSGQELASTFLVTVKIEGKSGEVLVARRGIQLHNDAFEHFAYKGMVLVKARLTPRFPELDADGVVRHRVHIWHHHSEPVRITRVVRRRYRGGGRGAEKPEQLSPRSVLGSTMIGAGKKIVVKMELDTHEHPDTFSEDYELFGESTDGWRAWGRFSLLRPPKMPTRDDNTPVRDPMLAAKILKAREILGKKFVTDEEIWRLEKQGAFAGLAPLTNLDPQPGWKPTPPKPEHGPNPNVPAPPPSSTVPDHSLPPDPGPPPEPR